MTCSNAANVLEGYVLLEVVVVDVGTPAIVASGPYVGIAVIQETGVTASGSVGCITIVESRVQSAVGANRGDIVATIPVEIKGYASWIRDEAV